MPVSGAWWLTRGQGFLLSEPITVWDEESTLNEQSPIPGLAVAGRASHLRHLSSGFPTGNKDLESVVVHAGLPGQVDHGTTVGVRRSGDSNYLVWETPGTISGWEALTNSVAPVEVEPSIVTLSDDSIVCVMKQDDDIITFTRDPGTGVWAAQVTVYTGPTPVYWPTLLAIDDEVYVLAWKQGRNDDAAAIAQHFIAVWRSVDGGASWDQVQDFATTVDEIRAGTPPWAGTNRFHVGRIRAAYRGGEVIVLANVKRDISSGEADYVMHFAGPSLTARLDHVETVQGSFGWSLPDVVATPAGFLVVLIERTAGAVAINIGSAWQPIGSGEQNEIGVGGSGDGFSEPIAGVFDLDGVVGLAIAWDPAGIPWVLTSDGDEGRVAPLAAGRIACFYSPDGGTTWSWATNRPDTNIQRGWVWSPPDAGGVGVMGNYPNQYGATWQRGRIVWAWNYVADVRTTDDSVTIAYLGGWTDLTTPFAGNGILLGDVMQWTWEAPHRKAGRSGLDDDNGRCRVYRICWIGYRRFARRDHWRRRRRGRPALLRDTGSSDRGAARCPRMGARPRNWRKRRIRSDRGQLPLG